MRTKNLNLKKKIAFIASVAMIATTAAYLPNEVINNLEASAIEVSDGTKGIYKEAEDIEEVAAPVRLQTVDVFVKINGKYLTVKNGTHDEYKLASKLDRTATDYIPVTLNEVLNDDANKGPGNVGADAFVKAGGVDPFGSQEFTTNAETAYQAVTMDENYEVIEIDDSKTLELPYFADATEVEFEFAAKKKNALGKNSVSSVTVALNKYGMGKVAKQNEYVIGKSDKSNFDENKKAFKKFTKAGSYEIIDFSGLVVSMTNYGNENKSIDVTKSDITEIKEGDTTYDANNGLNAYYTRGTNATDNSIDFVNGSLSIEDEDDITDTTYELKKVNGVYAKVITTKLKKSVAPNTVIKVNTGVNGNWTASGSNVSKGVVTVSMDKKGVATSGLVTITETANTSNKEYYVYVVENGDNALTKETGTATGTVDFGGGLTFAPFCHDDAGNANVKVATREYTTKWVDNTAFAATNYKVERETATEKINGNVKDEYVTKYIVYNNADNDKFDNSTKKITLTLTKATAGGYFNLAKNRKLDADGKVDDYTALNDTDDTDAKNNDSNTRITGDGSGATQTITLDLSDAGTVESAPIDIIYTATPHSIVKETVIIEFTNDFEIKYDNAWLDNREDNTKDFDGKVSVSGREVGNPGTVDRAGFDFQGWNRVPQGYTYPGGHALAGQYTSELDAAGNAPAYVYSTNNGNDQIEKNVVTPNTTLYAWYKGLRYSVEMDANGGYFASNAALNGGAGTTYAYIPGIDSKQPTVDEFATRTRSLNNNADIQTWKGAVASKTGFTFKGWNTDKDATDGMTVKELAKKFPGESQTLKVYAIYEANDVSVNFRYFPFETNGTAKVMDGKIEGTGSVGAYWVDAANNTAEFEKAADGYVTLTAGQKLGTLPTPYLKGYTFEGWYTAIFNNGLTSVTATKVNEDTVLDASLFADEAQAGQLEDFGQSTNGSYIYLYAKFVPKTYDITFDIGDGLWTTTKFNDSEEGVIPASVSYNEGALAGKKYTYKRADGSTLPDAGLWVSNGLTSDYNPKYGDNQYYGFKNWTINGGKTTYANLNAVKKAIENMDDLENLVIKANYEVKNASTASIFLNANEGAIYTYNVADKNTTTKKPLYFIAEDENGLKYNNKNTGTGVPGGAVGNGWANKTVADAVAAGDIDAEDFKKTGQEFIAAAAGTKVSDNYKIEGNGETIEPANGAGDGYIVARPGYTFTGWYTDKECTKPYTFDVYPEKGKQTILFAGWEASTTVRYHLAYDLFNGDSSEATDQDQYLNGFNGQGAGQNMVGSTLKYYRTFMGTAGEKVKAADLVVNVKDGTGTQSAYTKYVFDSKLSKNLDTTEKELKCEYDAAQLAAARFEQSVANYTLVEGRFIEDGFQKDEELGKATNVKGTANGKKVTISFTAADNAVKYQVCKIVNGKKYYTAKTDATSIDISPATTDYQVYVIAFDKDGKSTHSETIKLAGVPKSTLGTVKNPKVTESLDGDKKIGTVTWDAVEGATWYKVFKVVNGKTYWGSKVTENKYVFKNLPKDSSYIIYVAAGDDKGNVTYGARTKISKYPAVQNVKISADKKTVSFDKAEGAVNYQVAKLINGKTYYGTKSASNSITMENAAKSGTQIFVLAFFTGEDGKTYSSYSQSITVE